MVHGKPALNKCNEPLNSLVMPSISPKKTFIIKDFSITKTNIGMAIIFHICPISNISGLSVAYVISVTFVDILMYFGRG